MKEVSFLFEDPTIPGQKYALISIVGPHMPQKCDVWGLKIRGVADTIDQAKALCKKLMRVDNNYDIYTVEVGKFFPLHVEPQQVGDIEYENEQLNQLVKSYLENREAANEEWLARKNKMVQEAIREGKSQEELANKPEHPVAVLQRIKDYQMKLKELEENMLNIKADLDSANNKFSGYSQEEREQANQELKSAVDSIVASPDNNFSIEEIREQLMNELSVEELEPSHTSSASVVQDTLDKIKQLDSQLEELEAIPITNSSLKEHINKIKKDILEEKEKLTDSQKINQFINSQYGESQYSDTFA